MKIVFDFIANDKNVNNAFKNILSGIYINKESNDNGRNNKISKCEKTASRR